MALTSPSLPTIKRLFAVSGNNCAFPKCPLPLVDFESGKVTGRICHIKARNEGGARYDKNQTDEERHGFENLVLMCAIHHDVIDSDEISFTVERLNQIKSEHEKTFQNGQESGDEIAQNLIDNSKNFTNISSTTSQNQTGGQTANQINNFLQNAESANDWENKIKIKRYDHDLEIFKQSEELFSENILEDMVYWLLNDDSCKRSHIAAIHHFRNFFKKASNQYLDNNLNISCRMFFKALLELDNFTGKNFFYHPNNQERDDKQYCLYPDLNIDRLGSGEPKEMSLYETYADQMTDLTVQARIAYRNYRKKVKEILFV